MPPPDDAETSDIWTVAGIAILAACAATVAHEAIGHGTACLISGGRITQLTSVYFSCSVGNIWIPASGPIGNLATGTFSWLVLALLARQATRLRLFLVLLMAFSLFWAAGYLLYSVVFGEGDYAFAARRAFGALSPGVRIGGVAAGAGLYAIAIRMTVATSQIYARVDRDGGEQRPRSLLRLSWIAGSAASSLAALAYAPDRLGASQQASLEIGVASLPLLGFANRPRHAGDNQPPALSRSFGWILAAFLLYATFVATLGRGLG